MNNDIINKEIVISFFIFLSKEVRQMAKKQTQTVNKSQETINYDNNLLTFAERKYFELLDSEQFREINDDYEFVSVMITKKGKKVTTKPTPQSMYEKISKVKNEVKEAKLMGDGEYSGFVINYNVIKKGYKKPSVHEVVVAFVGDNLVYSRK